MEYFVHVNIVTQVPIFSFKQTEDFLYTRIMIY